MTCWRIFKGMKPTKEITFWDQLKFWFFGGTITFIGEKNTIEIPVKRFTWVGVYDTNTYTVRVDWEPPV